jgi:outer membrane protein TolC
VELQLLPEAERSHDLAARALALGNVTVLATLEGQRAVLAARESLVRSRLEAALARVELERALGAPLGKRVTRATC